MNDYYPDKWVLIKVTVRDNFPYYRVFGTWFGGYVTGDHWRLNSGVVLIKSISDGYGFYGGSGSIYYCHNNRYGCSGYTQGVLDDIISKASGDMLIEIVPEDADFLNILYS